MSMTKLSIWLAAILVSVCGWSASSFAQASGQVHVRFVKAGFVAGAGGGSGTLTYRGHSYPFRVTGLSLGITAGASIGRLAGRANGLRDVRDFSGTYSAVGGGGALAGGAGAVHLRNEKGVVLELRGPRAGMEFAANISGFFISLNGP
jgi:hypothetical protein